MNMLAVIVMSLANLSFFYIGRYTGINDTEKKYCKLIIDEIEEKLKKIKEDVDYDKN